jgi:hypothetical protein
LCRTTPFLFAVVPTEWRSSTSFSARLRGTPNLSAVSIGVAKREVILIGIVLCLFYIRGTIVPIKIFSTTLQLSTPHATRDLPSPAYASKRFLDSSGRFALVGKAS